MSNPFLKSALATAALLFTGGSSLAAQSTPAAPAAPAKASTPAAPAKAAKPANPQAESPDAPRPASPKPAHPARKPKARPSTANLVNINGASEAELMKLPGITKDLAARIVVGRPYGSKSWLATHGVIPPGTYQAIHKLIIAKQSDKMPIKPAKK